MADGFVGSLNRRQVCPRNLVAQASGTGRQEFRHVKCNIIKIALLIMHGSSCAVERPQNCRRCAHRAQKEISGRENIAASVARDRSTCPETLGDQERCCCSSVDVPPGVPALLPPPLLTPEPQMMRVRHVCVRAHKRQRQSGSAILELCGAEATQVIDKGT